MEQEEEEEELNALLHECAGSGLDAAHPSIRSAVLERIRVLLQQTDGRKQLAETWNALTPFSTHASVRLATLLGQAVSLETTDPVIQQQLCRGLVYFLQTAKSIQLVKRQAALLGKLKDKRHLGETLYNLQSESDLVLGSVALGGLLAPEMKDWWNIVLSHSTSELCTATELALVGPVLASIVPQSWEETILPALQLKLKSHPDRALSTILGWIQYAPKDIPLDSDWLVLLTKHLVGAKEGNRNVARRLLCVWASTSETAAQNIATAVAASKASLGPARVSLYGCLQDIASLQTSSAVIQSVLQSMLALVQKEKGDGRIAGFAALVEWMAEAKRAKELKSYKTVIEELVHKPVQAKKVSDTALLLISLVQRVHPDFLESIAADIWIKDKTWSKNIETFLATAETKKAAHVDALVLVYFALLHSVSTSNPMPPAILKAISAGLTKKGESFIYSSSMIDTISSNELACLLVPRILALYTVFASKHSEAPLFATGKVTAASKTLARCCVVRPPASLGKSATTSLLRSVETILTYQPSASDGIVRAMVDESNHISNEHSLQVRETIESRAARESETVTSRGMNFDPSKVQNVAHLLAKHCLESDSLSGAMVLMHGGSTSKAVGRQRKTLIDRTLRILRDVTSSDALSAQRSSIASSIVDFVATDRLPESDTVSGNICHQSTCSLFLSLGSVASGFSRSTDDENDAELSPHVFASHLCVNDMAPILSSRLDAFLREIETISAADIDMLCTPSCTVFRVETDAGTKAAKAGPKHLTENEEWELEMKKELEAKKKGSNQNNLELSTKDKELLETQNSRKNELSAMIHERFFRLLDGVRHLCLSDIEVGNECLPLFSSSVQAAAVSVSPVAQKVLDFQKRVYAVLVAMGSCVYEIHEAYAASMATAIVISLRRRTWDTTTKPPSEVEADSNGIILPLPAVCPSVATVVQEMDDFQEALSGTSFLFLFPIIQATLVGPRTTSGCENSLKVMQRHTELLYGDSIDPVVSPLRKDMAVGVLGLLEHDRAQTFVAPTPFEVLVDCYRTSGGGDSAAALTTAELAPLLDERGSLGDRNCRIGSMLALEQVAKENRRLVKINALVENRVWLNCFDEDEEIRISARKAWAAIHNVGGAEIQDSSHLPRPSPLYAPPLLPLLSHENCSIANAAAKAFAHAMGMNANSVARNIEVLCTTYIDAFPASNSSGGSVSSRFPAGPTVAKPAAALTPAPKKKISTGLPKKRGTTKKSALAVAGIGRPKTTKKKASHAALLKPKQERTLDQDALASQFNTSGSVEATKEKDSPSKIAVRLGVLQAIDALSNSEVEVRMDEETLKLLTSFLMAYGIADAEITVKSAARNSLRDVVASNGGSDEAVAFLLPHLEAVLSTGVADEVSLGSLSNAKVPKDTVSSDRRKEGAVVALGAVALHLKGPENDTKIDGSVDMLLSALKTPSEEVQLSVADTLTKLMKKGRTQERVQDILTSLLENCLGSDSLASRRGAAYGLAAAVKGSGITTLKKYDIVRQLEEACSFGSPSAKEGSLFAIELLSNRLGLLFEPYVIVLLPSLLKSFSDSSDHVRNAASNTAGLIMSKLSAHGVKLVLPAVLKSFDDSAWRTKQASIQMLGAMSHLAPKQLASALPKVVPQLTEAFSDTHTKVKTAAQDALNEITTVVKNPEIASISKVLLKALTDPADHTITALEALIETEFLHSIDAPSLALIVPILHRGLRDRGATTKRFSGLIAGNICTMINDPKDFVPYLPTLLPDIQSSLLDPIPDVRNTSAKALGSLTRSLGDHILLELRPWLIQNLRKESCSSAERSGAAQGLTEVLIASGSAMVDDTMRNEILPLRSHPEAGTREGVLWMLTFLPPALGQGFTSLIDVSLPAIISGLSDDSEPVRDVALRSGRVLIRSHGKVHVDKILPSLEASLSDDDHRIRVAALSLLGDLLSMIGGTQLMKGESNTQDDIRRAERAQAQIAITLGSETRKRVLSGLYMARNDSVHMVRQSSIQVWKTVVSVTARTLRDILPVLVTRVVTDLASGHPEKTEVAGRCLGDVVSKLGDSVLPQIIPVLRNALDDGDNHTKRGVCVGLTEVISCSTKDQILRYIEIIVKVVQDALSDDDEMVRKMAATSFQSLYNVVGARAMDEVVPSLMVALESGEEEEDSRSRAINGLTGILSVRSRELLPYIIPRLIERPVTTNHAQVLTGVAKVTGSTLHYHFSAIIPVLLAELSDICDDDDGRRDALLECSRAICSSTETIGVNWLISEIASKTGSDKAAVRKESCRMFEFVCTERAEVKDFYEQVPIIMRELLYRLKDEVQEVLVANHSAFAALTKNVPAEELVKHVEFMRNLLASMVSDARRRKGGVGDGEYFMPGFNIKKGLEPLIPIYQRGILYGSPEIREASASGLGEAIALTAPKFLAGPLIVKMTGPLLRIVGDRNPANVKVAILQTLGLVLVKGGPALRAFVPQFQTTFVKALSDPSRQVRKEAVEALSLLMPLSTRVDPLIKELVTGSLGKNIAVEGLAAAAVQTATLEALATVLKGGGSKAKLPASVPSALEAGKELLTSADEGIRESAAKVVGVACLLLGTEVTRETLSEVLEIPAGEAANRHGKACAIRRILVTADTDPDLSLLQSISSIMSKFLSDDKDSVREAACAALGATIGRSRDPKQSLRDCEKAFNKILQNSKEKIDMHRAVARGLCIALLLIEPDRRIDFMGKSILDTCLDIALKSSQRVQFAFNDVLWVALNVQDGTTTGLDAYCAIAVFDNQKSMKSLHSKVLKKINEISITES